MFNPDSSQLIVLDSGKSLESYEVVEPRAISDLSAYDFFLRRVRRGYQEYLEANSSADNRPYQYEYAAVMCCRRNNLMGWSMRTGKSLSSLLMLYGLYDGHISGLRPRSIHICVPSVLASMSWVTEMGRFPSFKEQFTLVQKEKDFNEAQTPVIIYSHDFPKRRSSARKGSARPLMARRLAACRPNVLIVDEVHGIKNKSARTTQLSYIRRYSRRVLGLTGTPSEGNLTEIHNILQFIYGTHWPFNRPETFAKRFAVKEKMSANYLYGSQTVQGGPERYLQHLDVSKMPGYYKLMKRFLHRVSINEPQVASCITIPETEVLMHSVEPTALQKEEYQLYLNLHRIQLQRAANSSSKQHTAEALTLINPLIALANHPEGEVTAKMNKIIDITRQAEGKVIIFCNRVSSAWVVSELVRKKLVNEEMIRVYAADPRESQPYLTDEDRINRVVRFQYEDKVKVGVFSINIASQAIELNQASDVIFYCLPWSSVKIQQAISRPVGPGNPHQKVKLHYLYQEGFIDEYQVLLAVNKIRSAKMMLDYDIDMGASEEEDLSPTDVIRRMLAHN